MGWCSNKVGIACAGWRCLKDHSVPVPATVLMANVGFQDHGWLYRRVIFHQKYQPRNQVMFASARPRANSSTTITMLNIRMNLEAGGFPFCPACQVKVPRFWQDILETRTQSHAHTRTNGWVIHLIHLPPSSPSRHYQLVGQSVAASSLPDPKIMLDKMPDRMRDRFISFHFMKGSYPCCKNMQAKVIRDPESLATIAHQYGSQNTHEQHSESIHPELPVWPGQP